ncbi:hypothetical protein ACHAWF_015694 [Thalassiosira exigua]
MGYEEVETVLPADFKARPDPKPAKNVPEQAAAPAPAPKAKEEEHLLSGSELESDAEDAGCAGKRRKRKKKKRVGRSTGRQSLLGRWRAHRSRSKSRSKGSLESEDTAGKEAKAKQAKSKSKKLSFRTIRKVDSNATEVRSNTTKTKEDKDGEDNTVAATAEGATPAEAKEATEPALPTVREGSPANTTVTALTDGEKDADKKEEAPAKKEEALPLPVKEPQETVPEKAPMTAGLDGIFIEVGDENEQVAVVVESPFNRQPSAEAKEEIPEVQAALSNVSAKSNRSTKSTKSTVSNKSGRSIRSLKGIRKSKDPPAKEATEPAEEKAEEDPPAATAPDADEGDAASVRSSTSQKSNRSTSSKRSLRGLKKSKSKDEPAAAETAPQDGSDKENIQDPPDAEAKAADTDALAVPSDQLPMETNAKWVKKVSLSIGGYKTSFQFSDPMANLADAVNDALDVMGGDEKNLVKQAQALDSTSLSQSKSEEVMGNTEAEPAQLGNGEPEDEERDYDEDPTRLFMYLQQRTWGLALTQLQKHPEEASVWVYRKARVEKAPDAHDADHESKAGAIVVQHTALVVRDGNEPPKYRWKLLPLHAAIVLGAPTEIIQDIIRAYPAAARQADERGSLPVHLAASRLDVDPEGEKVVLQLFGAYPDSIEAQDRKGRTPPELAKLARARKEIEEQRKNDARSVVSSVGQEASQFAPTIVTEKASAATDKCTVVTEKADGGDAEGDDDADDRSVRSSISGKFKGMLRKAKSTDTADIRKKKRKSKKSDESPGIKPSKSVDQGGVEKVADDASIAESLGPGFSFVKTSKSQEVRDAVPCKDEEEEKEEKELLVAVKKAIVGGAYRIPEAAPSDTESYRSIPLPKSFSMTDDSSVCSIKSNRSNRSVRSLRSASKSPTPVISPKASDDTASSKAKDSATPAGATPKDMAMPASMAPQPPASALSPLAQCPPAAPMPPLAMSPPVAPASSSSSSSTKSVKISEEPQIHEMDSDELPGDDAKVNEGLTALLEKAAENAGRSDVNVAPFVKTLEEEWVTDVEALRRLDGETLDEMLPLMLSREVQRIIHQADSIDAKYLKDNATHQRGRSPKKSSKKKKKKRSYRKAKKRPHYRPVAPPHTDGPLTPIDEDEDESTPSSPEDSPNSIEESPGAASSASEPSIVTEAARSVVSRANQNKLEVPDDDDTDEEEEEEDEEEYEDNSISHSASIEDLEIRKLHANLIADARKKFPTREALEDSIRERQAEVEAAVNSGFDVEKQALARAALADDEVRKLLPLRLILPTVADLSEMISVLQIHKEDAMRALDMEQARGVQGEIDELKEQIDREERYLLKKKMGETKCTSCGEMFPSETKRSGILKLKEKSCPKCRKGGVRADIVTVSSKDSS